MKRLLLVGMLALAPVSMVLVAGSSPAWARGCSGGANCTACRNCNGCAHCSRGGGTCSVCRPDLYQAASTYRPAPPPVYSPPSTYSPPVYAPQPAPRPAPRRRAATRREPRRQRQSRRSITVPAQWSGRVVGVADGDTLTVLYGQSPIRIRLYGVDAPEKAQAYGQQSKNLLSSLAFGKTATIYSKGADRYGRVLAWVFVGPTCTNRELVGKGMAHWYRQYSPGEKVLGQLETQAKAKRLGLWVQPSPTPPWDYRRGQR